MTDPTPTRAEVEAAVEKLANSHFGMSLEEWNAVSNTILTCAAENQALRERAEAADRGQTALRSMLRQAEDDLTEARRAEAAAWNDAIEAAARILIAETESCAGLKAEFRMSSVPLETVQKWLWSYVEQCRALRRAAPTEGEA